MKKIIKSCMAFATCLSIFSSETSGMQLLKKDGAYNESNQIRFRNDILYEIEIQKQSQDYSSEVCRYKTFPKGTKEITTEMLEEYRGSKAVMLPRTVVVPRGVISINQKAFRNCRFIENIILPSSILKIEHDSFINCKNLNTLVLKSVRCIDDWSFYGCKQLKTLVTPKSLSRIEFSSFNSCYNLAKVEILSDVIKISGQAFFDCYGLEKVLIRSSLVKIDEESFSGCINLTQVLINSDEWILVAPDAFFYCDKLYSITVGSNLLNTDDFLESYKPKEILNVPKRMTELENMFYNDSDIKKVVFENGSSITKIDEKAFMFCENLFDISIPKGVNSIEFCVFFGCIANPV